MGTTVSNLFKQFKLTLHGQVKWNVEVESEKCGVYVVAISDNFEKLIATNQPNFNDTSILNWIELIESGGKTLLVDFKKATVESIKQRLSFFWFHDETILYIGKAGPTRRRNLKVRLNEFYYTKLGCSRRHGGGHWLNTLSNLNDLNIFYSETDPEIEEQLIKYFSKNVSEEAKSKLYDKLNCFPFANKELNKSIRKIHGLSNQTIDCNNNWKK